MINSVHSSDGCYTYVKEISGGQCAISLGAEEQQALSKALMSDVHVATYVEEDTQQTKRNKYMVDETLDLSDEEYYD